MIRPFDVISTTIKRMQGPDDFISEGITLITGGPSHVRLYCKGLHEDFDFWEVTYPKCRFGYISEINRDDYQVEIGRHKDLPFPLPQELLDKGLAEMLNVEGSLYDIGELFFSQLFDIIGLDHSDQSDPKKFVCSSGIEHILTTMNFPFCPDDYLVSPEDIIKSICYERVEENE